MPYIIVFDDFGGVGRQCYSFDVLLVRIAQIGHLCVDLIQHHISMPEISPPIFLIQHKYFIYCSLFLVNYVVSTCKYEEILLPAHSSASQCVQRYVSGPLLSSMVRWFVNLCYEHYCASTATLHGRLYVVVAPALNDQMWCICEGLHLRFYEFCNSCSA